MKAYCKRAMKYESVLHTPDFATVSSTILKELQTFHRTSEFQIEKLICLTIYKWKAQSIPNTNIKYTNVAHPANSHSTRFFEITKKDKQYIQCSPHLG
jgi:hypothetical protein